MPHSIRHFMRCQRGAVTAEFAVVLPAVVMVIAMILVLARFTMVSMACQDAAAVVVRELVIANEDPGQADGSATAIAQRVAGDRAEVHLIYEADSIAAETRCPVVPDPLGVLPRQAVGKATGVLMQGGA